ncbi:MAG TPA: VIT1/CCC1 transporter family protein, partial [Puia sp.]|nr:VIT1/CCC1 transporter family protein [Puia sp.]
PAQLIKEPYSDDRLLSPIERIAEILFGLIMALSFTCAISVFEADRVEVKEMLIGAIGCNIAWGIIDAIMYLMIEISQRGRNRAIVNYVIETSDTEKAAAYIAETLSPEIAEVMGRQGLENIRMAIIQTRPVKTRTGISGRDLRTSLGIFLLVFLSTFPVALPFALIGSVHVALRVSNGIAVILLFIGGWILARYTGYNKFRTGLFLALIGAGMVFLTISLGG